jgi:para-nitrobenzyl esterase
MGAYHAADLPYLFDVGYNQPFTNPQRHLPDHMIGYWTRFAPHGRPQRSQRTRLASLRYSTPPCPVPGPRR